jgi:hemolysin III
VRPRFRGVLHHYAFFASLPLGLLLVASAPTALAGVAAAFLAASSSAMFGVSAMYHRITWSATQRMRLAWLDHAMIYVLIASTYTAYALLELSGWPEGVVLAVVWAGAAAATASKVLRISRSKTIDASIGLALGSIGFVMLPELLHRVGVPGISVALAGGALYAAGAVVYALRRPNPRPTVFGYHEIFHAFVVAGATCQFIAIAFFVIPGAASA